MAHIKVDYYKDMGTGEKHLNAGDPVQVKRAKDRYVFVAPIGGDWLTQPVHIDNIISSNNL